jgi:IS30 family transposase
VSREIARNGGRDAYRALEAEAAAFQRARRPKDSKLATNTALREVVTAKLDEDWSPQQISQWLRRAHPEDLSMRVSHESIYRDVYTPSRKVFPQHVSPSTNRKPDSPTAGQEALTRTRTNPQHGLHPRPVDGGRRP